MKVLFVNVLCGAGSTGRIVTDLANAFVLAGHECLVAYGRGEARNFARAYKISSKFGTYFHALMTRFTDRCGLFSAVATKKLIKKIETFDPDIINLHNLHGYYINYKILFRYLKKADKPVVWTFHDCWAFTGHCAHFDLINCAKWTAECCRCPQKSEYPASYFIDRSCKNFRDKKKYFGALSKLKIVTPSIWLKDLSEQSFFKGRGISVINNGIDTEVFKPTPSDFRVKNGLEDKKIVLGVASEWTNKKGFADFLRLSEMLPAGYKIVLVGLSGERLKDLPTNILGMTKTDNATELAKIYTAADVFVNPTYEDTFPTVNLEARSCSAPVVTYGTGGSPESVPAENVCPRGDLETLLKKIVGAVKGGGAKTDFNGYGKDIMTAEYLKLFSALTDGKGENL